MTTEKRIRGPFQYDSDEPPARRIKGPEPDRDRRVAAAPAGWQRKPRPRVSRIELFAMSRMLRLHLDGDRFFNPLVAMDQERIARDAMKKIEALR